VTAGSDPAGEIVPATFSQRSRWRSLLFVPGDNPSLLEKAPRWPADGLIFDLEDAVSQARKGHARTHLREFSPRLAAAGADLLVRVNNDPRYLALDVNSLPIETRAIVLPKTETVEELQTLATLLSEREAVLGLERGSIGVVAMVESPSAMFDLLAIARGPRVIGLALGSEDLSTAMGIAPSGLMLAMPAQLICLAAAASEIMAFAVPFSIAAFRDEAGWAAGVETARALGATGGFCVHPSQITAVNGTFSPTPAEITWAEAVLAAWAGAERSGQAVSSLDGNMIDRPVIDRARALLGRRLRGSG
jgi:citrate lyase subunit beta/citryl-CoA lyase